MKKITPIILLFSILFSCSNDETDEQDQIVGRWEYSTHFIGNEQHFIYNCKRSTLHFYPKHQFKQKEYITATNGDCAYFINKVDEWSKIEPNKYRTNYFISNHPYNPSLIDMTVQNDSLIILILEQVGSQIVVSKDIYIKKSNLPF